MIINHPWLTNFKDLEVEIAQCKDEGLEITEEIINFIEEIKNNEVNSDFINATKKANKVYELIDNLKIRPNYKYVEPSKINEIKKERDVNLLKYNQIIKCDDDKVFDKIYGAWLGRCVGCLLGQPIERWKKDRILGLLKDTNNYPINYYISSDITESIRTKYGVIDEGKVYGSNKKNWINNVSCMPEDDDTNYTIIALKLLEEKGRDFTPEDIAEIWLMNLPVLKTCTAERVAYKNLLNLIAPPYSASFQNPYRELIGAQIRADLFGYINIGNIELAAGMAWMDGSISHIKNGIYGEMFVASMIAYAGISDNIEDIIMAGLSQIPKKSRLYEDVTTVINHCKEGKSYLEIIDIIHNQFNENNNYDWCHTNSNAMIVVLSLLYGELDLGKSIGIAVESAFDTDCNGATVGSIIGMILGKDKLDEKWIQPLNDKIKSGVDGFGLVSIKELAERTTKFLI